MFNCVLQSYGKRNHQWSAKEINDAKIKNVYL